jgi:hypothetical protein
MQIERSATSISWIPSQSLPAPLKIPWDQGVMHYDPPPPLTITDLEGMRRRGEFRFANLLRAWIDVEDGTIRDCGYAGGLIMGLTPITVGSLRVLLPTKANPELRPGHPRRNRLPECGAYGPSGRMRPRARIRGDASGAGVLAHPAGRLRAAARR